MLYLTVDGLLLCRTGGLVDDMREWLSREDELLLVPQVGTVDELLTACDAYHVTSVNTKTLQYMQNGLHKLSLQYVI